jgi:hypothetical protein
VRREEQRLGPRAGLRAVVVEVAPREKRGLEVRLEVVGEAVRRVKRGLGRCGRLVRRWRRRWGRRLEVRLGVVVEWIARRVAVGACD